MSVADELNRIRNAKNNIKASLKKRGASLDDSTLIDSYSQKLESVPYGIRGYFTPEVDTQVFSISGLPFAPQNIYMVSNELYTAGVNNGIAILCNGNGLRGSCVASLNGSKITSFISENSSLDVWGSDGYEIDLSKSSSAAEWNFKAGYTYEYYISGGFSQ